MKSYTFILTVSNISKTVEQVFSTIRFALSGLFMNTTADFNLTRTVFVLQYAHADTAKIEALVAGWHSSAAGTDWRDSVWVFTSLEAAQAMAARENGPATWSIDDGLEREGVVNMWYGITEPYDNLRGNPASYGFRIMEMPIH